MISIAEVGEHGSIAPEILGTKNRDFWGEISRIFYYYFAQNRDFFMLCLLKFCLKA